MAVETRTFYPASFNSSLSKNYSNQNNVIGKGHTNTTFAAAGVTKTSYAIAALAYDFDFSTLPADCIVTKVTFQAKYKLATAGDDYYDRYIGLVKGALGDTIFSSRYNDTATEEVITKEGTRLTREDLIGSTFVMAHQQPSSPSTTCSIHLYGVTLTVEYVTGNVESSSGFLSSFVSSSNTTVSNDTNPIGKDIDNTSSYASFSGKSTGPFYSEWKFDTSGIPSGAEILSVAVLVATKCTNTFAYDTFRCSLYYNGEEKCYLDVQQQTSSGSIIKVVPLDTWFDYTGIDAGGNFILRLAAERASFSSPIIWLYGARLRVVYSLGGINGSVNIGGTLKELVNGPVNINGVWKELAKAYENIGGVWKES